MTERLAVTDTVHVHPIADLVAHDTSTDQPDCACGLERDLAGRVDNHAFGH